MKYSDLTHPMDRATTHQLGTEDLRSLHLELFGRATGDSIKRRLSLKIWRAIEARYEEEGVPVQAPPVEEAEALEIPEGMRWPKSWDPDAPARCCPRCEAEATGVAEVLELFGVRKMGEVYRLQSYCTDCRGAAAVEAARKRRARKREEKIARRARKREELRAALAEAGILG